MKRLTWNQNSYFLDGKPIWLVCGEMHYFRVPRMSWRDRMRKAKENGITCISTYMAWCVHEPEPGVWDFTGEKDVEAFVQTAREEGLYVVLRPGPYVCSELDFGGLPGWLTRIDGPIRTWNPEYSKHYEAYYRQILPRLARLDVEHGGNIVLIQNENEHIMPNLPGRTEYFRDLSRIIRECGFEIPIIHCNRMLEGTQDGVIECVNTWDNPVEDIRGLRRVQPDAPQLITELWCGGCDAWREEFRTRSPWDVWQKTMAITMYGGQYTYYMWHGGTNFGFLGGRLQYSKDYFMITSYDLDAPLSEGGVCGEKYHVTGLVNRFASSFGSLLSTMEHCFTHQNGQLCIQARSGKTLLQLDVDEREKTEAGADFLAEALPWGGHQLSFSHLFPLWQDETDLYLYGRAGSRAGISIDGELEEITVENRSWSLEGRTVHVLTVEEAMHFVVSGKRLVRKDMELRPREKSQVLPAWQPEAVENPEQKTWIPLDGPQSAEALGQYYGYLWYRLQIPSDRPRRRVLSFFGCNDRCTVYHQGHLCGIWGPDSEYGWKGVPVELEAGLNTVYILCDNLGRLTHSYKLGEQKGMISAPCETNPVPCSLVRESEEAPCQRPALIDWAPDKSCRSSRLAEYEFEYEGSGMIHLQLGLRCCAAVLLNGQQLSLEQNPGVGYADLDIPAQQLHQGKNILGLRLYSSLGHEAITTLQLTREETIEGLQLSWAPWDHNPAADPAAAGAYPEWYSMDLTALSWIDPAFIEFPAGCKGQLEVNGFSAGRIWSGKPQGRYYIPHELLTGEVKLRFYSENGENPGVTPVYNMQKFWNEEQERATLDVI